jgi:hypothetical protein
LTVAFGRNANKHRADIGGSFALSQESVTFANEQITSIKGDRHAML